MEAHRSDLMPWGTRLTDSLAATPHSHWCLCADVLPPPGHAQPLNEHGRDTKKAHTYKTWNSYDG